MPVLDNSRLFHPRIRQPKLFLRLTVACDEAMGLMEANNSLRTMKAEIKILNGNFLIQYYDLRVVEKPVGVSQFANKVDL